MLLLFASAHNYPVLQICTVLFHKVLCTLQILLVSAVDQQFSSLEHLWITAKASAGFLLGRILAPESFCSHPHTASECLSCRQAVRGECRSSKLHCLDGDMGRSGLVVWDAWTRKCCPGPGWKVVVLLLFCFIFCSFLVSVFPLPALNFSNNICYFLKAHFSEP